MPETASAWLFLETESHLYTVGFYKPDGKWEPESDYESPEEASKRVHYLNGGAEGPFPAPAAPQELAAAAHECNTCGDSLCPHGHCLCCAADTPQCDCIGIPNVPAIVHQAEQFKQEIGWHLDDAAEKAVAALSRYKFQMFGYWAAMWVHLNRLSGERRPNPFADLVNTARYLRAQDEIDREEAAAANEQSASEAS